MFVRKLKNRSGSVSIQIIDKTSGHYRVIKTIVSDENRSNSIWYAYDDNGRLSKVWSNMFFSNRAITYYGIGVTPQTHPPTLLFGLTPSGKPDIEYSYDNKGNLSTALMANADAVRHYRYSSRGWLDSLIATRTNAIDTLFMEALIRSDDGRILKQVHSTAETGVERFTQEYTYDRKMQLTEWNMKTDKPGRTSTIANSTYSYDSRGNRISSSEMYGTSDNTLEYSVINERPNAMKSYFNASTGTTKNYEYNRDGAIVATNSFGSSDLEEKFEYYASGLIKSYTASECALEGTQKWEYQYSGVGGRESKRLTFTPKNIEDFICSQSNYVNEPGIEPGIADSSNHDSTMAPPAAPSQGLCIYAERLDGIMKEKPHWAYYLRGAAGEELAQYVGVKSKDGSAAALVFQQYSVGGEFIIAPDGNKSYFISDHQGNVRCKFTKNNAQFFEYTPFGAEIDDKANDPQGWIASERDFESKYMNLCFRLYDPTIGRFLSVDPLFEMQPGYTPYHYCFNDPVNGSDPSGLKKDEDDYEWDDIGFMGIIVGYRECSVLDPGGYKYKSKPDWRYDQMAINELQMNYAARRMCNVAGFKSMFNGLPLGPVDSDVYVDPGPRVTYEKPSKGPGYSRKILEKSVRCYDGPKPQTMKIYFLRWFHNTRQHWNFTCVPRSTMNAWSWLHKGNFPLSEQSFYESMFRSPISSRFRVGSTTAIDFVNFTQGLKGTYIKLNLFTISESIRNGHPILVNFQNIHGALIIGVTIMPNGAPEYHWANTDIGDYTNSGLDQGDIRTTTDLGIFREFNMGFNGIEISIP